jgi:hypothetical protein
MEIAVSKFGRGIHVPYGYRETLGLSIERFPSRFKVGPIDKWAITFGTSETRPGKELTGGLAYTTAPWNEVTKKYDTPWHVLLPAQPWRIGEYGETSAEACLFRDNWNESFTRGKVPLCAAGPLTFLEASRPQEIQALLKFGTDSAWPLKTTAASSLDEQTSLSTTDDSGWEDCDGTIEWVWLKFTEAAKADQIAVPPEFGRQGTTWFLCLRKENDSMHILVRERRPRGTFPTIPEDAWLPVMTLYGPSATIELRQQTPDTSQILQTSDEGIIKLYQGRMRITEQLPTTEWAMI